MLSTGIAFGAALRASGAEQTRSEKGDILYERHQYFSGSGLFSILTRTDFVQSGIFIFFRVCYWERRPTSQRKRFLPTSNGLEKLRIRLFDK